MTFPIIRTMNPIPVFLHTIPPYMHTHMLFSRSYSIYTLLCALETAHTPYTIYFALIHHCTNSLSSLHIFVHHCTFCASLHTKTSPDFPVRRTAAYRHKNALNFSNYPLITQSEVC